MIKPLRWLNNKLNISMEKEDLIIALKEKGIKVDKRYSIEKLNTLLEEANNPKEERLEELEDKTEDVEEKVDEMEESINLSEYLDVPDFSGTHVFGANKRYVRTYTKEGQGENYLTLAEGYAKKINGKVITT